MLPSTTAEWIFLAVSSIDKETKKVFSSSEKPSFPYQG